MLILIATLFFGILLGLLIPAVVQKVKERKISASRDTYRDGTHRRSRFVGTLHRVIEPDSAQREQMTDVTEWAAARIDSIESSANRKVEMVFDSVTANLTPILTEEQRARLEEFHDRSRRHWHSHDGRRRR